MRNCIRGTRVNLGYIPPVSWSNFIESRQGLRSINLRQSLRRFYWELKGVEPRSKNAMPEADKVAIQESLTSQLKEFRRRSYRGPVALKLWFGTTEPNPAHIQTITKNLLDLFAVPRHLQSNRKALLYLDDSQISGLSVHCDHGCPEAFIRLQATPFHSVLHDLDLIGRYSDSLDEEERFSIDELENAFSLQEDIEAHPERWEPGMFQELRKHYQGSAQASWLKGSTMKLLDLVMWYALPEHSAQALENTTQPSIDLNGTWYHLNPGRILLRELPHAEGQSADYRAHLREVFDAYQSGFGKHLRPMQTPIGIEVLIKPPLDSSHGLHDLDNACRDYLLPRVAEAFSPPIPKGNLASSVGPGVDYYEVWRLTRRPEDNTPGFVSIALAPSIGHPGMLYKIDKAVEQILDRLD